MGTKRHQPPPVANNTNHHHHRNINKHHRRLQQCQQTTATMMTTITNSSHQCNHRRFISQSQPPNIGSLPFTRPLTNSRTTQHIACNQNTINANTLNHQPPATPHKRQNRIFFFPSISYCHWPPYWWGWWQSGEAAIDLPPTLLLKYKRDKWRKMGKTREGRGHTSLFIFIFPFFFFKKKKKKLRYDIMLRFMYFTKNIHLITFHSHTSVYRSKYNVLDLEHLSLGHLWL